jgi:hypothetical protein
MLTQAARHSSSKGSKTTGRWVPHDTRDQVVDYVRYWNGRTEVTAQQLVGWLGIRSSKFHDWQKRYGKVNEHNAWIPRDWWLEDWEKEAIVRFAWEYPLEGYRRLAFMMLDRDVVAASPSSVYRVLKGAGRIGRQPGKPSRKGTGFQQPIRPHEHWHLDISYIKTSETECRCCHALPQGGQTGYSSAFGVVGAGRLVPAAP